MLVSRTSVPVGSPVILMRVLGRSLWIFVRGTNLWWKSSATGSARSWWFFWRQAIQHCWSRWWSKRRPWLRSVPWHVFNTLYSCIHFLLTALVGFVFVGSCDNEATLLSTASGWRTRLRSCFSKRLCKSGRPTTTPVWLKLWRLRLSRCQTRRRSQTSRSASVQGSGLKRRRRPRRRLGPLKRPSKMMAQKMTMFRAVGRASLQRPGRNLSCSLFPDKFLIYTGTARVVWSCDPEGFGFWRWGVKQVSAPVLMLTVFGAFMKSLDFCWLAALGLPNARFDAMTKSGWKWKIADVRALDPKCTGTPWLYTYCLQLFKWLLIPWKCYLTFVTGFI